MVGLHAGLRWRCLAELTKEVDGWEGGCGWDHFGADPRLAGKVATGWWTCSLAGLNMGGSRMEVWISGCWPNVRDDGWL